MTNILTKLICKVPNIKQEPEPHYIIRTCLTTTTAVYSYLVYAEYTNDQLIGWQVEFLVSQTERFNTMPVEQVVKLVKKDILSNWQKNNEGVKYVIGYKQPPIDLLIEIFDPLVKKLAEKQQRHWGLEYEDLCQMCRLTICVLHSKGYYIHRRLIEKAFYNYVLQHIRKERYSPGVFSIEDTYNSGDDTYTALEIVDEVAEQDMHSMEEEQWLQDLLQQKKDLVCDIIGERNYKQLLREYGSKSVSASGAKQVFNLKKQLEGMGITYKSFK